MIEARVKAKQFFDKLWTKQWLAGRGFDVPRTLAVCGLGDVPANLGQQTCNAVVVKPVESRLSRGVFILKRLGPDTWRYGPKPGQEAVSSRIPIELAKSLKLGEEANQFFLEEAVFSGPSLQWAQRHSSYGPAVLRFVVYGGWVMGVVVSCPHDAACGLAGAVNRGPVNYAYLTREGLAVDPKTVAPSGPLARKHYGFQACGVAGVAEVSDKIERLLAPDVIPVRKRGRPHPWCVDGVFEQEGHFVVLELNHTPGHKFKQPLKAMQ